MNGVSRPVWEAVGGVSVASPQTSLSAELGGSNQRARKKGHQEPLQRSHAGGQRSLMFVPYAESSRNLPAGGRCECFHHLGNIVGHAFLRSRGLLATEEASCEVRSASVDEAREEDTVFATVSELAARGEFSNIGVSLQPL